MRRTGLCLLGCNWILPKFDSSWDFCWKDGDNGWGFNNLIAPCHDSQIFKTIDMLWIDRMAVDAYLDALVAIQKQIGIFTAKIAFVVVVNALSIPGIDYFTALIIVSNVHFHEQSTRILELGFSYRKLSA